MKFFLLGIIAAVFSSSAVASYDANMSGQVEMVAVYTDADYLYFRLANQPTAHNGCNPSYFVVMEDVPQNRRNQMYAQLLAAKESGEQMNVGYAANGDCAHGYIRVYRVG